MRYRFAALVLTVAACGLVSPTRAADPAPASDLTKYLPEGAGFYVHISVQQFLAAPVVRKAIPLAAKTFEESILQGANIAMMFAPKNAGAPMPTDEQIKAAVKTLQDPQTIATAFDAAKDAVTDIVVAGEPGSEENFLFVTKCSEKVTPEAVNGLVALAGAVPQIKIKSHEKNNKIIYEIEVPQQPQSIFVTLPEAGVICIGASKDLVEKAANGKGKLKGELKSLVAERKKTDFVFFAMAGASDEKAPRSGWGRLVLDSNISGEISATFSNGDKAAEHAKEVNEHIGHFADTVKGALGSGGKDVAAALEKAKAVTSGSTVTAKFSLPGSAIEKLLSKEKE
jgi:hypothetical protein